MKKNLVIVSVLAVLVLTDEEIPSTVTKFKFYYTGSSTFSPSVGYGCVNSKQTEIRTVADGVTTFDIFTLPHTEEDVLTKLTQRQHCEGARLRERSCHPQPDYPLHRQFFR